MSIISDASRDWPHSVYRCFDADDRLLYIGCASDVPERMYHLLHPCNGGLVPNGYLRRNMARWTQERHPTRVAARAAERHAIAAERPLLNRQHNPARFRKVAGGRYVLVEPVDPITAEVWREWVAPTP